MSPAIRMTSPVLNTAGPGMRHFHFVLFLAALVVPNASVSAMSRPAGGRLFSAPARGEKAQSRLDSVTRSTLKARDVDQAFLRALVDHLEGERLAVHAVMETPNSHASHGTAMDPANWDGTFDSQQTEALALLQHDYRERWSPKPPKRPAHSVAKSSDAEVLERTTMQSLVSVMREGVALTDRYLPRLRRASSRDLARRVRSSHVRLIKELGAMSGH